MIMCVLLCYPVSIPIYYQQGRLFLVINLFLWFDNLYLILEVYNFPVGHSLFIYIDLFDFILVIRLTELFVFDYPFCLFTICAVALYLFVVRPPIHLWDLQLLSDTK